MRNKRQPNDLYPTYNDIVLRPIKGIVGDDMVLEPCVGHNHIGRHFSNLVTVDKYKYSGFDPDFYLDMTEEKSWIFLSRICPFDWVVTNPPYSLAPIILPMAYRYAKKGAIFLLRLSYLEPCKDRAEWLKLHSKQHSDLIVLNPRINFHLHRDGTDSVTSAWFVWTKSYDGLTRITYFNY